MPENPEAGASTGNDDAAQAAATHQAETPVAGEVSAEELGAALFGDATHSEEQPPQSDAADVLTGTSLTSPETSDKQQPEKASGEEVDPQPDQQPDPLSENQRLKAELDRMRTGWDEKNREWSEKGREIAELKRKLEEMSATQESHSKLRPWDQGHPQYESKLQAFQSIEDAAAEIRTMQQAGMKQEDIDKTIRARHGNLEQHVNDYRVWRQEEDQRRQVEMFAPIIDQRVEEAIARRMEQVESDRRAKEILEQNRELIQKYGADLQSMIRKPANAILENLKLKQQLEELRAQVSGGAEQVATAQAQQAALNKRAATTPVQTPRQTDGLMDPMEAVQKARSANMTDRELEQMLTGGNPIF